MRCSLSVAATAIAITSTACNAQGFENLVTFGDSYTDDGRLSYYVGNNGSAPPPGVLPPQSNVTASGGLAWGQWVQQYTGVAYFDYAVSGATCSNEIVSRNFSLINNKPFPSVIDDEIPSFIADVGAQTLYLNRTAENTVYALWIGTNDLGYGGFLTDSQAPGTNITTYIDCVWSVFDAVYSTGGRRFVVLNTAPLQYSPIYAAQPLGTGDNQYWANKTLYNQTEYQYKMMEYTQLVNRLYDYGVAYEALVEQRWPGATFDVFDVNSLLTDIYQNPSAYLDAPANATGYWHHCSTDSSSGCVNEASPLSSFLWYDELHPSEKAHTFIAREFINVVGGNSSYGKYFH